MSKRRRACCCGTQSLCHRHSSKMPRIIAQLAYEIDTFIMPNILND